MIERVLPPLQRITYRVYDSCVLILIETKLDLPQAEAGYETRIID
jgi:hypothetical protein